MASLTYAFSPLWLGLYCMQQTAVLAFMNLQALSSAPGALNFAEKGQRLHPVQGILECKALGKPCVMLRRCSGDAGYQNGDCSVSLASHRMHTCTPKPRKLM